MHPERRLAAHIRNMRSNYGMGAPVSVIKTGNGRMSEAQAAVALFNLNHYSEHQQRNERLFGTFRPDSPGFQGLGVRVPSGVSHSNYQNLICLVDEAAFGLRRDDLWRILRAENLLVGKGFYPPMHRRCPAGRVTPSDRLPHTERYAARTIELPMNRALTEPDVAKLIELLALIQHNAAVIRQRLAEAA